MKNTVTLIIVVLIVFVLGLSTPFALVQLGLLSPSPRAAVAALASTPASTNTPRPTRHPEPTSIPTVTLRAAPGNNIVQMFHSLTSNSEVTRLATGLRCDKLDGPISITESGVSMSFYKVSCNGQVGYVNIKWVR